MPDGLNKVMLIGNVGGIGDSTSPGDQRHGLRYTANGNSLFAFSLAVNRTFVASEGERREETEWFEVVAWGKLAETLGQHLQKGRKVYVEGRLATRSWEGPDGQKRYRTEVIANQVLFLDRPQGATLAEVSGDIDPDDLPFDQ